MAGEVPANIQQISIVLSEEPAVQVELGAELVTTDEYEEYTGAYTLIPSSAAQTLYTAEKYLSRDIRINEIPYAEVSNGAGGNTVTIG